MRISANYDPGTPLINNAISVEAAVWPEAFAAQEPEVYSADDDPETYPTLTGGAKALINHSWKFWFQQENALANGATAGVYHSYQNNDASLWWMRAGDYDLNAHHYSRENLSLSPAAPRQSDNLKNVPTLMINPNGRHYPFTRFALNLPVGTMPNPVTSGPRNHPAIVDEG